MKTVPYNAFPGSFPGVSINMHIAVMNVMDRMADNYAAWRRTKDLKELEAERETFRRGLSMAVGKKYIKIVSESGGAEGFIVNTSDDKTFRLGDMLKSASWSTPARNFARGNVLDDMPKNGSQQKGLPPIKWTGIE
jgi:hypothetical protein